MIPIPLEDDALEHADIVEFANLDPFSVGFI
jgi:hypothetical protein